VQAFIDQSVKTPTLKTQQKIFLPLSPRGNETHAMRDTTRLATQLLFCDNFTRLAAAADPLAAALRPSTAKEPTTSKEQPSPLIHPAGDLRTLHCSSISQGLRDSKYVTGYAFTFQLSLAVTESSQTATWSSSLAILLPVPLASTAAPPPAQRPALNHTRSASAFFLSR
jgi:hypothetical protein